jgi:hypothetical protein
LTERFAQSNVYHDVHVKVNAVSPQLKLLPPTKPRLGLYLRPGRNDHTVFEQLLAEDRAVSGLVLDARHTARHAQLRELLVENGVQAVLDTDFMELASPGGSVLSGLDSVPWVSFAGASAAELRGSVGRRLAEAIAGFVEEHGFSAVLAPTHLLLTASDEKFAADRAVASELRRALDARGQSQTAMFYPLAIPGAVLRDRVQRAFVSSALSSVDIDAVWLRIHPFGTSSAGPIALRQYLETAWDLRGIGVPLVGERTGTVGLALMAFGGVGGIESGITLGERFDAQSLLRPRPPSGEPFSPGPRVYLHEIGAFASRSTARTLFQNRQMIAGTGCRDLSCCRNGVDDMLKNPRRHFVLRRTAEVDRIGGVAPEARANVYLREILQPAALLAVRAARVAAELQPIQRRLESWNLTLGALEALAKPVPIPAVGGRLGLVRPKPQSLQ